MSVNIDSIMKKVGAWEKSDAGQKRIQEKITEYQKTGVEKTQGGTSLMTEAKAREAAQVFIDILIKKAEKQHLHSDVLFHIQNTYRSGPIIKGEKSWKLPLYFGGDLRRRSLRKADGTYTGDGIDNIVALFNNGYKANQWVFGEWEGHKAAKGERRGPNGDVWIRSAKERDALRFIQRAKFEFDNVYGKEHNIEVQIADTYYKERNS